MNLKNACVGFLQIMVLCCVVCSQTAEEFFKQGKAHQIEKKYYLAEESFSAAINANPDYAEAYFERARTRQLETGKNGYNAPTSIFADFGRAINLSPNVANFYYHRGLSYLALRQPREAVEDLTKAITLAPDQIEGYRVRFEAYLQLKDLDKALVDINKAIELQPDSLVLRYGRAALNIEKNDCSLLKDILSDLTFIIDHSPDIPVVYEKRAKTYAKSAICAKKTVEEFELKSAEEAQRHSEILGSFINRRAKILAKPQYPPNVTGVDADVQVKVTVSGDGKVIDAVALYGDARFRTAAETAAKATTFPPTTINGKPIETWGVLKFNFISPRQSGQGTGSGNGSGNSNYVSLFVTDELEVRRYLPGDTEPLSEIKTFVWGEYDLPTTNKTAHFTGKPTDTPLKLLNVPKMEGTDEARRNQVKGIVALRITFLANGAIGNISVVSGLPYGLNEMAISAAKKITFIPATKNGIPVSLTKRIEYSYEAF